LLVLLVLVLLLSSAQAKGSTCRRVLCLRVSVVTAVEGERHAYRTGTELQRGNLTRGQPSTNQSTKKPTVTCVTADTPTAAAAGCRRSCRCCRC
jgi:hypothetical protein